MQPVAKRERVVVTGAAGFIGSHLCEALLAESCVVVGIDCFVGTTPRATAEANLAAVACDPRFTFVDADLRNVSLGRLFRGVATVFHVAARPGVRQKGVAQFLSANVDATRRVLRAAHHAAVERVVFTSSSSVYGAMDARPSQEDDALHPRSVYACSKWLAEQCCAASQVPVVTVRYFTVYGPRQRPDMAFARFIDAMRGGPAAPLYGEALRATRDFTFVGDAVDGTLRAWRRGQAGRAYNISGGVGISLAGARGELERLAGAPIPCIALPAGAGEAPHTRADLTRAWRELGYRPRTELGAGLQMQLAATIRNEQLALGTG